MDFSNNSLRTSNHCLRARTGKLLPPRPHAILTTRSEQPKGKVPRAARASAHGPDTRAPAAPRSRDPRPPASTDSSAASSPRPAKISPVSRGFLLPKQSSVVYDPRTKQFLTCNLVLKLNTGLGKEKRNEYHLTGVSAFMYLRSFFLISVSLNLALRFT